MSRNKFYLLATVLFSLLFYGGTASAADVKSLYAQGASKNNAAPQERIDITAAMQDSSAYSQALDEAMSAILSLQKEQALMKREFAKLSKVCDELNNREADMSASLDSTSAILSSLRDSLSASQMMMSDMNALQLKAEIERSRLRKVDIVLLAIVFVLLCFVVYALYKLYQILHAEQKPKDPLTTNESAISNSKFEPISYDAAVDAWIHINNNLATLGKYRWQIQNVYAFLAGYKIDKADMQQDLATLDDDHKETISIIISDIERFKVQHLSALEKGLSIQLGHKTLLKDAVRFPNGQAFNCELDEELTGDPVEKGAIVSKVASLGYLFPESRNGCYRVKSKVLIQ